jgi:hypothetical protein
MTTSDEVQLGGNQGSLAWIASITALFIVAGTVCGIVLRPGQGSKR